MNSRSSSPSRREGGLRTRSAVAKAATEDQPLVSVITVVRNGEKHLETTIQNVINQTYQNIEYILMDGLSTDSTLDIIRKYEDRIAYWVSEPDSGIYDAMNKGIALSTGGIVGIINSDDWYAPGCIQAVVDCFKQHPGIGVVHGDVRVWRSDGKHEMELRPRDGRFAAYVANLVYHSTCFVAREVYSRHGTFDTKYQLAADYELMLRLRKQGVRFYYVSRVLSNVRLGGTMSRPGSGMKGLREYHAARKSLGYNRWVSLAGFFYGTMKYRAYQILVWLRLSGLILFYRRYLSRYHRNPAA